MRPSVKVGDKFVSRQGCEYVVIEYNGNRDVRIKFLDEYGHVRTTSVRDINRGFVKNPYRKSLCGVGYYGEGPYRSMRGGKTSREYVSWSNMIKRCYDENHLSRYPTYRGCTVAEEWHNFQTFAAWLTSQPCWGEEGWHLDKDLLVDGNKEYSPKTCVMVPSRLNILFGGGDESNGNPVGVSWSKQHSKYSVRCKDGEQNHYLGLFESLEEASEVYVSFKRKIIQSILIEHQDKINDELFIKMWNYSP